MLMLFKAITIGGAVLVSSVVAGAQERGTVEFGMFGSLGRFDQKLTLDQGVGVGGRVGVFLNPRVALEFEKGEMRAERTLGLKDVNVGILSGRLVVTPIRAGRLSILLGAGAGGSTETNFLHSYDLNALLGAKIGLTRSVSLRADVISAWLANPEPQNFPNPEAWRSYQSLHVGLNVMRNPIRRLETVQARSPAVYIQAADSVAPEEIARLRRAEMELRALRDSVSRAPGCNCQAPLKIEKEPTSSTTPIKTEKDRRVP
jgi:hypothetical protein